MKKKISFLGDSITTFKGYIPEGYEIFYPYDDVEKVEDTWWYQLINKLGYELCMNDSYSGSKIATGEANCTLIERVKFIRKDNELPDVLVIYMGTNDWAHGTKEKEFEDAYYKMIENIYECIGRSAKMYILTSPYNNYSDGLNKIRRDNNEIIKKIAKEIGAVIIDLDEVFNKDNFDECMCKGVHPNKLGMKLMADYVYSIISKYEK